MPTKRTMIKASHRIAFDGQRQRFLKDGVDDIAVMAAAGCSVAHALWVFARRSIALERFALDRKVGINMTLRTDG